MTITEKEEGETSTGGEDDEYNFDKYDNEDENVNNVLGIDTVVDTTGEEEPVAFSDDDSEKEDDIIKSDDNLIITGHVEGDSSVLEVYGKQQEKSRINE